MPVGVIDESYIFHALFIGTFGDPVDPTDATIEVFAFEANGDKVSLVAPGTPMVSVPTETGRYIYLFHIPADYALSSTLYGTMTGTDPNTGVTLTAEEYVEVHRVSEDDGGYIQILDQGVEVDAKVTSMNFVGADVVAIGGEGSVTVYIPPPSFASHYMTNDGDTGAQFVSESTSRTNTRLPTPSGGEGNPFHVGDAANTNFSTTRDTTFTFTHPGLVTGLGGDSTFEIEVFGADGVSVLDSYTTPALTQNQVHTSPSGALTLTVQEYAQDVMRFKGKLRAEVDMNIVFGTLGTDGGRFHVKLVHISDSVQDAGDTYTFVMEPVFLDTDPSSPSIGGSVGISETVGNINTKHLSGVEYYILGSQFTIDVEDINRLGTNTYKISSNLNLSASKFGLPSLSLSPFGNGSGGFSNYTNEENNDGVDFLKTNWSINNNNYRFFGNATASATVADPWSTSAPKSDGFKVLIDTYGVSSTHTYEPFNDEAKRLQADFTTSWDSEQSLVAGDAMVFNGRLQSPSAAQIQDFTTYKPDLNGVNPDYTGLSVPVNYYRFFTDTSGMSRSSFQMILTGSFVSSATNDLANEDLQIFVRRFSSAMGGQSGTGADPLLLHGDLYNNAFFNDAAGPRNIRLATSSGNTINGTFGGFACEGGMYVHVRINNDAIRLTSISIVFV